MCGPCHSPVAADGNSYAESFANCHNFRTQEIVLFSESVMLIVSTLMDSLKVVACGDGIRVQYIACAATKYQLARTGRYTNVYMYGNDVNSIENMDNFDSSKFSI